MNSKEILENKKIEKVINYIVGKYERKEKITKEDDTVYYICQILTTMGIRNNFLEILKLLSPNTKEAFSEMNASNYGEIFDDTYNLVNKTIDNEVKGLFKYFKLRKFVKPIIGNLYSKIDNLNKDDDFISNYLIPYIDKNYSELFNNFQ